MIKAIKLNSDNRPILEETFKNVITDHATVQGWLLVTDWSESTPKAICVLPPLWFNKDYQWREPQLPNTFCSIAPRKGGRSH